MHNDGRIHLTNKKAGPVGNFIPDVVSVQLRRGDIHYSTSKIHKQRHQVRFTLK
jgi:hypothetical protein